MRERFPRLTRMHKVPVLIVKTLGKNKLPQLNAQAKMPTKNY